MRFNRLAYQILLVFVIVIIVCLGVSGWFMTQFSEDIVTRKISEGDLNFAGRIAQQVAAEMASVKPTLTLLAESTGLRLMEATEVKGEIDRVQRSFPDITSIYVADVEGEQIARTGTEELWYTTELENVSRIWSFQVARGGDELVSDIYLKPATSEPMQTITLPIIDNGAVVGVLSADICFTRIMVSVMDIYIGKTGNVVVVADNGRVVAHTRMKQVPELDLSRLLIVEAVLAGEEGTMKGYTDELGRQVLGSYMPIRELGWGVIIQRPLADIGAEVGQLRTTIILVMIAAVLLAMAAGWLMSRQIIKPIRQLASASERVAQGDLSTTVDVKSSNEVGVLAHSFNQMIVSLKKSRDELQQWGEALRESEEKHRTLTENVNLGIYRVTPGPKGEFIEMNPAFIKMFGYKSRKEMLSINVADIYQNPKDRKKFSEKLTREGLVRGEELQLKKKDGTPLIGSVSDVAVKDEKGRVQYWDCIVEDITERKKVEEALRESEARLRVTLDYILLPEKEEEDVAITDLVNIEDLQRIQDTFALANGVASIISDVNGNPITKPSNFSGVCKIIRSTEKGSKKCMQSAKILGDKAVQFRKPIYEACHSIGFLDASAPIIVGGKHIANWLIGQTRVGRVEKNRIKEYAKEIGADADKMLKAFEKIPEMSMRDFEEVLDFLWVMAKEISTLGHVNLKLAKDITERKRAEGELRKSEEKYRTLTENVNIGIYRVTPGPKGEFIEVNPALIKILGCKNKKEVLSMNVADIYQNPKERKKFSDKVIRQGFATREELQLKKRDGTPLIALVSAVILRAGGKAAGRDDAGNILYFDGIMEDITERKRVEEELRKHREHLEELVKERTSELEQRSHELADINVSLEEMSRHKSQFLANMSHELRTPLNSIIGYTKLMLDGLEGDINEEQQKDLQTVHKNSKHLLELINGLLDLSRIEAGKIVLSYEVFTISDFLAEVIPTIEPLTREKGLTLTHSVGPEIDSLYADRAKTKQVLINILGNAVKFTNEGSVKLNVVETDSDVIFSVTDTGIGMKKDDLEAIFDSFKQVGPAQIAGYEGTGLGLAISKQFIEMQGGRIWAESELGKGTTFTFTLPKKKTASL